MKSWRFLASFEGTYFSYFVDGSWSPENIVLSPSKDFAAVTLTSTTITLICVVDLLKRER